MILANIDGTGKYTSDDGYTIYYSGDDEKDHRYGVALVVNRVINESVINFIPISDRIMMLQLQAKPVNVNLIQCYTSTADKDVDVLEEFYQQIKELKKLTKEHDVNITMDDFNAKIGEGSFEHHIGQYDLGTRNKRGERLIYCQEQNLVMNIMFK